MSRHLSSITPRLAKSAALVALAAMIAPTMLAAPAMAAGESYYAATLATPLAAPRKVVVGDVLWNCDGARCTASQDTSRPAIVCARLQKAIGPISHFATPATELAADDLAKCNAGHK